MSAAAPMPDPASSPTLSPPSTGRRSSRRRRRRQLIGFLVVCLALFLLTEVVLRIITAPKNGVGVLTFTRKVTLLPLRPSPGTVRAWQSRSRSARYTVPDPDLGWTLGASVGPSTSGSPAGERSSYSYTTNAQGIRAPQDRVYAPDPAPGKVRLVLLGDSFTHGDEVNWEETWGARLEGEDPRLETLNLGAPGYGTDQAFLRWRKEGRDRYRAHAVVLGIWLENVCRNLNLIRFWFSPLSGFQPKPRFVRRPGGELELVNVPVPDGEHLVEAVTNPLHWGAIEHERWYEPALSDKRLTDTSRLLRILRGVLHTNDRKHARDRIYTGDDPEGIALTVAIARKFAEEVKATGAVPIVLMIPMRDFLDRWPGEWDLPLAVELKKADLNVINLYPAARYAREKEEVFLPSGHLTPAGHAAMARELIGRLGAFVPELGQRPQDPPR